MNSIEVHMNSTDRVLQEISQNVHKIGQLGNELETLNQNINVSGNSRVKSDLLNRKEKDAIKLIEATGVKFTELASHPIVEQATKIHAERLKTDFQRSLQRFQRIQAEIKRRLVLEAQRNEPPVADLLGLEPDGVRTDSTEESNMLFQTGQTQLQVHRADQGDVTQLGYVLQQEEQMQAIEEDIMNVNIIFEQLSTLVYDQRTAVDTIEDNVESAYVNQVDGTAQLMKAAHSRQRARKRCCVCSIILITALCITILVLIIVYGPKSKN
uniref:Syntaxin 7 n=1 Tax=Cryptocotyle lingua TaxID=66766 RepID=A0A7U0YEU4_9TREM|nr:syntaxin 7 [Cryptocotyle lingua]